jgi:hypothetical protein
MGPIPAISADDRRGADQVHFVTCEAARLPGRHRGRRSHGRGPQARKGPWCAIRAPSKTNTASARRSYPALHRARSRYLSPGAGASQSDPCRGVSSLAGRSGSEPVKPRNETPAWNGLRVCWECRAGGHSAKAMSAPGSERTACQEGLICLAAHPTSAKMLWDRNAAPYPTAQRILDACMQIDAFALEHPLRQADAQPRAPL